MTSAEERLSEAERALARIRDLGDVGTHSSDLVSFGMLPFDLSSGWRELSARFQSLLTRLTYFASADTPVEAGVGARSVCRWSGAIVTVWTGTVTADAGRQHLARLEADIRYRARLMLVVTAAIQAAAAISAAAASPLLAMTAFRSATRLVDELQALWQASQVVQ